MADKVNVITIVGSLRKGSFNAALARQLPKWQPAGMNITPAPDWRDLPIYNADDQNSTGFPATATKLGCDPRRRWRDLRHAGIQLRNSRRVEERDRLGIARPEPAAQGKACGDPVGDRRPLGRRSDAISLASGNGVPERLHLQHAGNFRRH